MKPSLAVPAAFCLLGLAGSLAADEPVVSVGARVRFTAPFSAQRVDGTILALDESSFTLKLRDEEDPTVFTRSSIERLEVRRPGKRLNGGFAGFLAGTAIGVLAAVSDGLSLDYWLPGLLYCAFHYGIPGAVAGAIMAPGARWEEVPQRGISVSVAPRRDRGFEARLTVQF